MSFGQGLSGLNASSKNLDVIGNNIANSATVGFKGSQAQFADIYAASLSGAGSNAIGIGTKLAAVAQQFNQGNVTTTNNPLDVAINGNGMFAMSNNGSISYTRNGQFQLDKNGVIVGNTGLHLQGYPADKKGVIGPVVGDLKIDMSDQSPIPTSKMSITANLDSRQAVPKTLFPGGAAAPSLTEVAPATVPPSYIPPDPSSYNESTSISVYDSLGNSHVASLYFCKEAATPNTWSVYMTMDNGQNTAATPGATFNMGTLAFDESGKLTASNTGGGVTTLDPQGLDPLGMLYLPADNSGITWDASLGITQPQLMKMDFSKVTQFGSKYSVTALNQDGNASGSLSGFHIDQEGMIQGRYSNGATKNLGQVALTTFANLQGLQPIGNNQWLETPESGVHVTGKAGSGKFGVLQSSATEDSNVDLTQELVGMISAQRSYQANAQTIKTQDQVMQTIVNLR
ncbi:MAG: flagellar hook protein FlgE [Sulfuricellaceae bacterium]